MLFNVWWEPSLKTLQIHFTNMWNYLSCVHTVHTQKYNLQDFNQFLEIERDNTEEFNYQYFHLTCTICATVEMEEFSWATFPLSTENQLLYFPCSPVLKMCWKITQIIYLCEAIITTVMKYFYSKSPALA